MRRPRLRDELLRRVADDRQAAEALFADVDADEARAAELDVLLASPETPLLVVLPEWPACPLSGDLLVETTVANARWLAGVVHANGWPGLDDVGGDGTDAAWLVAQHADLENELRRTWIDSLAEAVWAGQADPRHLACLVDRVAVVAGRPQTYGTVALLEDGALVFPHPVAEPAVLDQRRLSVGLPPVADDVALLELGEIVPFGPDRLDHPLMHWPLSS